jgi:hypothetical protein
MRFLRIHLEVFLQLFAKQHEFVCRVGVLFERADQIEWQVVAATRRTEAVTQAALGKGFKGELVPTKAKLAGMKGNNYRSR